jgi:hypothetical protein
VLAETIDRGRRANLGPAIVRGTFGRGAVIYIGSSLEAVYEETRMERLRSFLGSLVEPYLAATRSYQVDFVPGVTPNFMASRDVLLLHLLADTGNKNKHLRAREGFLPVAGLRARIRIPNGRRVRSARLLRSGEELPAIVREGWLDVEAPRIFIHEAIRVDLV